MKNLNTLATAIRKSFITKINKNLSFDVTAVDFNPERASPAVRIRTDYPYILAGWTPQFYRPLPRHEPYNPPTGNALYHMRLQVCAVAESLYQTAHDYNPMAYPLSRVEERTIYISDRPRAGKINSRFEPNPTRENGEAFLVLNFWSNEYHPCHWFRPIIKNGKACPKWLGLQGGDNVL